MKFAMLSFSLGLYLGCGLLAYKLLVDDAKKNGSVWTDKSTKRAAFLIACLGPIGLMIAGVVKFIGDVYAKED